MLLSLKSCSQTPFDGLAKNFKVIFLRLSQYRNEPCLQTGPPACAQETCSPPLSHLLLSSMDASSLTMLVTGPVPAPWQISQHSDYSNKTRPQTPEGLRHTLRFLFLTIAAKLEVKNLTSAHNLRLCLVTCPQRNSRCIHFSRKSLSGQVLGTCLVGKGVIQEPQTH